MNIKNLPNKKHLTKEKVHLVIEDAAKFQEIALAVDNPRFLEEIGQLRREHGIEAPVTNICRMPSRLFIGPYWDSFYSDWCEANPVSSKGLPERIRRLRRNLGYPSYLDDSITQAILLKAVLDSSGIVRFIDEGYCFDRPAIAIFPTPHTTYEDVKGALKRVKECFRIYAPLYTDKEQVKMLDSTKRNRHFYWERLSGKKYSEIVNEWIHTHPNETSVNETEIIKGVARYMDLMQKYIEKLPSAGL